MVELVDCGCGKTSLGPGQLTMHRRSKQHKEWENVLDPDVRGILDAARTGESPFHIAKMVRSLFDSRDWPNDEHPGTVRDWLVAHNIPIIDVPPHVDPDEQRRFLAAELSRIRAEGWGKTWEVIYG